MNLLKHYFNMNLAVRNTYHFFITKRDIKVKSFSTLSSLLADNNSFYEEESGSSLIEEGNSNNSENNDNNLLSPIESENSPHSNRKAIIKANNPVASLKAKPKIAYANN